LRCDSKLVDIRKIDAVGTLVGVKLEGVLGSFSYRSPGFQEKRLLTIDNARSLICALSGALQNRARNGLRSHGWSRDSGNALRVFCVVALR
jgi:hypothetical protein